MDELMKLFATKNTPLDINDMPLSTLIENNNESMDVNLLVGIILETMLIEETLILDRSLVIPLIIMEIPTIILMVILIRCPLILNLILKNLFLCKRILMIEEKNT